MPMVGLELLLRKKRSPWRLLGVPEAFFRSGAARLERGTVGEIAFEVGSVELHFLERALVAKGHDAPVKAGKIALAAGFPAVAHVHAASGGNKIILGAKKHVVARQHLT